MYTFLLRKIGLLYFLLCTSTAYAMPKLIHIAYFTDRDQRTTVEFFFSQLPREPKIINSEKDQKLTLQFAATKSLLLQPKQEIHLDPVTFLHIKSKEDVHIDIHLQQATTFTLQHSSHSYKLMFDAQQTISHTAPPQVIPKIPKIQRHYTGKKLSLTVENMPIKDVLRIIAKVSQLNLVTSDAVKGNLTLNLKDVPWDQALDLILKLKNLEKRYIDQAIMILPSQDMHEYDLKQQQNMQELEQNSPLATEVIQINYAKAETAAKLIQAKNMNLLSRKGFLSHDTRTNILIIHDTQERVAQIKNVLMRLDVPIQQVTIEARVITLRQQKSDDLGIRWGSFSKASHNSLSQISVDEKNWNINLPAVPTHGKPAQIGLQVAKIADDHILDLELSALEQEQHIEILASPRITTVNHQTASIEQGSEIPYVESSSSGATSVVFKKAALSLQVTPQILPNQRILMDLKVKQDHRGDTVTTSTGQAISIDMQRMSSRVLVENKQTLIIGGIYQKKVLKSVKKVPWLGDLPGLGFFFRSTRDFIEKSEILIFVTPKIMHIK